MKTNNCGWRRVERHSGLVTVAYLVIIMYETLQEDESDKTRKEGHGKSTDGTKVGGDMGHDGERRKTD